MVTWDPCHNHVVRHLFERKAKKRLNDMMSKVRRKGTRPPWIRETPYKALKKYWAHDKKFKDLSNQNKINRASTKGGAVHTSGRKAHIDLALELVSIKLSNNFLITVLICALSLTIALS